MLRLTDTTSSDFVAFFAPDADAAPGTEVDVTATFQIQAHIPNNADAGNRVVINDGATRSAIAACIIKNGERGIGLLSQGATSDSAAYPVFVAVDWGLPVTIRLRRTAVGDAELMEVNGVAPNPRAILLAALCPAWTRTFSSFEFGCRSVEAQCGVDYLAYQGGRTATSVPDGPVSSPSLLITVTPNPSRGEAVFTLHGAGQGSLEIIDVGGRLASRTTRGESDGGSVRFVWDGRDASGREVAPGTYFVRLSTGGHTEASGRVVVVR